METTPTTLRAHAYDFPFVPDGDYIVRMHFADGYEPDGRAMDWTIEGVPVLEGFSIQQEVELFCALVKTFAVTVSDADGIQVSGDQGEQRRGAQRQRRQRRGGAVEQTGRSFWSVGHADRDQIW